MSEFAQIRYDFNRIVARDGWDCTADVRGEWPVPAEKWLRRYYKVPHFDLSRQRRLINHFKVGADPEFVFSFLDGGQAARVDASTLGLRAGLAYGADNNGRLVEIRPQPNRFVLSTLASLWSTFKWLSLLEPRSLEFNWRAGAFYMNDGLGGHVHFGRKRPTKERETDALDTLSYYMFASNIWDSEEGRLRIRNAQGAQHGHGYGHLSDRRDQPYGYEYRTFPSWVDSPWMSYFTMTLAKLAVHDPELLPKLDPMMERWNMHAILARLKALLAYYKGRDDDAALAYEILGRQGFPKWGTSDFKRRWGIVGGAVVGLPKVKVDVIPDFIPPFPEELEAIRVAMLEGHPPELVSLEPSWKPSVLPKGYITALKLADTLRSPGLGEIASQLCTLSEGFGIKLITKNGNGMGIANTLWQQMGQPKDAFKGKFPDIYSRFQLQAWETKHPFGLSLGTDMRSNEAREKTLAFLTCGMFPLWRLSEVTLGSVVEWLQRCEAAKAALKPRPIVKVHSRVIGGPPAEVPAPVPGAVVQANWADNIRVVHVGENGRMVFADEPDPGF